MPVAEELRQRTFRYALRTIAFCRQLPETWDTREIAKQLLRAGTGTAANYWSACRGRSTAEFIARLGVAEDEVAESVMWLMLAIQSGIATSESARDLLAEGRQLTAILSKSVKTARENRRRRSKPQVTKLPSYHVTNSG